MYLPPSGLMSPRPKAQRQERPQQRQRGLMGMPSENWFALAAALGAPQGQGRQEALMNFAALAQRQREQDEARRAAQLEQKQEQDRQMRLREALMGQGGQGGQSPIAAALPFMDSDAMVDVATQAPSRYSVREGEEIVNYESHPLRGTQEIGRGSAHRRPDTTQVNLPPAADEYEQTLGTRAGEYVGDLLFDNTIYNKLESARTMSGLIAEAAEGDSNFYTGPGGELRTSVARFGEALGIDMSELQDLPAAEAMRAITNEMAANLRSLLPGPMSDSDREFLEEMVPSLSRTPEGNRILIDLYTRTLERQAAFVNEVRRFATDNGRNPSYQEVTQIQNRVLSEYGDLFTPQDRVAALRASGMGPRNDPRE